MAAKISTKKYFEQTGEEMVAYEIEFSRSLGHGDDYIVAQLKRIMESQDREMQQLWKSVANKRDALERDKYRYPSTRDVLHRVELAQEMFIAAYAMLKELNK